MLKNLFFLLFAALLSVVLFSCADDTPRRQRLTPAEQAQQLKEALDLSDEQVADVEKIFTRAGDEMKEMRGKFDGDRSEMRKAMQEFREKTDQQIEEILTVDQKEKYRQLIEERREKMREGRPQRGDRE